MEDKWKEVDPQSVVEYILPDGVIENCNIEIDKSIFIGTNRCVPYVSLQIRLTKEAYA